MLGNENGNLADVRSALGRDLERGDIVDYTPFNSALAEIVPNTSPHWHIIETHPNSERTAARHLIARRFGVFIPEIEETIIKRGRKVDRTRLMFTGYIFIFVWDVMRHLSRIQTIPGIARVMHREIRTRAALFNDDGVEVYPAVIEKRPVTVSDLEIDQIRAVENGKRPLKAIALKGARKKGRWRNWIAQLEQEGANDIVSVSAWSPFQQDLATLDSAGRNQTLLKALSLT